jgi:hypothetical protein
MKSINTVLGWLLMLAVLAIPSFLFYNWWSKNKMQGAGEAAMEVPVKDVFSQAEQQSQPRPAFVPEASTGLVQTASAAQLPVAVSTLPAAEKPLSQAVALSSSMPPALQGAAQPQPVPGAAVARSTGPVKRSYYAPKGTRNPMLSMQELDRIKEAEQDRIDAERQARMSQQQTRKPRDMGIENRIRLQGVVGNAAIINGEMYYEGQSVLGGKLIKVTDSYIIMEHKGKRFRKNMQ